MRLCALFAAFFLQIAWAQQPPEPVNITPNDGEIYYLVNQQNGLQAESESDHVVEAPRNFSSLEQRWVLAPASDQNWEIVTQTSNSCMAGGIFDDQRVGLVHCQFSGERSKWNLIPASNGYYAIRNVSTHRLLDASSGRLAESPQSSQPSQSQLWLLRPVYLRGIDNALLEKQEMLRVSQGTPWWKDNFMPKDVLAIFKDHGINTIRLRPSSSPPYVDPSAQGCSGNGCYAETDAQDLDLAKRAKNLGMSIELTLLFDGGNSQSIPPAWASDTLQQAQTDLYAYVKTEIERYRAAGVMPDLVAIGNEVDTGFLGALGSPTGANFGPFAALQKSGMQAVADAAADPSLGAPIPAPLTCIHITPAWDLTSFFTLVNQNGIPYDVICQSYYPFYHGPLTDSQAAAANPYNKPVEQDVLTNAANNLGKPLFLIETGEHYENGFSANDPWYTPSIPNQRQFLLDLQSVVKALPNNLGMGVEYWDAAGVNILAYGGPYYFNGGWPPNSIYIWNGLTLFDNADTSGSSNQADPNYSELLTGLDAVGNKLDPMQTYKLVTPHSGILGLNASAPGQVHSLTLEFDSPNPRRDERWTIVSNRDGFFQIRSAESGNGAVLLDGSDPKNTVATEPSGSQAQEWDVHSLSDGVFEIVNRASGVPVSLRGRALTFQITPTPF